MTNTNLLTRIRILMIVFVLLLMLSGITAFPVYTEMKWIMDMQIFNMSTPLSAWIQKVWTGVQATNEHYDFMFYGYDWMAFAHIIIGLAFIGPYRDPIRNKWIIDWAMIACVAVLPLAAIAGPIRHIPWFHILIDCSFGVIGIIPLLIVRKWIGQLEKMNEQTHK
jgi:hypothetical protein